LGALRDSLFGVVLPPLVTSLYHFADRPDFVDVLPALLQLLWELDEMNKFFVASKAAFKNLHLAQEADKQKRRQEAAAIAQLAAIEASRTPSTKDRKARGYCPPPFSCNYVHNQHSLCARRKKSQTPVLASPLVSRAEASLPEAEDEVEAPVSYPFAWLLELEKTLGTVCGMLSSSLMAGTPETSQERPYLSHLRSDLFSAGLEDSEDEALVDASATEGMDVDEGASKTAPQGDFFKRLMAVDESDDELGPLVKWISAAGPRLPIPAQAEKAVASAVRGTFAAVVKHANLEPQLVEWASQLRTAAQKRMDLDAKEGDSDDSDDPLLPPSPPPSLQSLLSTAGSIRLWIMQQQQTIMSQAVQKHDEEMKQRERRREEAPKSEVAPSRQAQDEHASFVARARQSLQQLQQQILQQNLDLDEEVMWDIMVEEEEEARLRGEEEDDDDVEEDDDEELDDEAEEDDEEAEAAEEEKARSRRAAEESARRAAKAEGKKKATPAEEKEEAPLPELPTREEVYTRLAKQVLDEASFLLRFAASAKSGSTSQELMAQARATISFIQLLLPLEPLEQLVRLHTLRSKSRCRGLRVFIDLLDRCSLPSAKREIVKHLGRSLRYPCVAEMHAD
jgi:hypothetical protein